MKIFEKIKKIRIFFEIFDFFYLFGFFCFFLKFCDVPVTFFLVFFAILCVCVLRSLEGGGGEHSFKLRPGVGSAGPF